jgi:hypothetical protein
MTKVIILGEQPENKELEPIEFVKWLDSEFNFCKAESYPMEWKNIELICKNYQSHGFDLMFAYQDERNKGVLYLGHFNDGII